MPHSLAVAGQQNHAVIVPKEKLFRDITFNRALNGASRRDRRMGRRLDTSRRSLVGTPTCFKTRGLGAAQVNQKSDGAGTVAVSPTDRHHLPDLGGVVEVMKVPEKDGFGAIGVSESEAPGFAISTLPDLYRSKSTTLLSVTWCLSGFD
jgi:hypothetical protein